MEFVKKIPKFADMEIKSWDCRRDCEEEKNTYPEIKEPSSGLLRPIQQKLLSSEILCCRTESDESKETFVSPRLGKPPRSSRRTSKRIIISNKSQIDSSCLPIKRDYYLTAIAVGKKKTRKHHQQFQKNFYPSHFTPKIDKLKGDRNWLK